MNALVTFLAVIGGIVGIIAIAVAIAALTLKLWRRDRYPISANRKNIP